MSFIKKGVGILLLSTLIIVLNTLEGFAQIEPPTNVADTLYRVETNDGNVFIGEIVEMSKEKIVLQSEAIGTITLYRKFIVKIEQIIDPEMTNGDLWYRHLQSARYFFAPNGYGLKKGESYYQNIWIFYNQFSAGLSDHFSIGFGMMPLFFFDFAPTPIWIAPKFSVPIVKDKINLGAGALLGYVIGEDGNAFGIVFASGTFGPHDKNLSIGLGYAFAGGEFNSTPIINLGGLLRVSRNSYLMTENYIVTSGGNFGGITILGARSMINKTAIDYGLAFPFAPDMGEFLAIPWLGLSIPFHKN
jgi:hypothetical protein